MAIITRNQFTSGIKTLDNNTAKAKLLIQELLITAVFFAESDGDVAPITRVVDAIAKHSTYDMWKVHAWLKKYEAPIKPSDDGKTYVFDKTKRHLTQNAPREDFTPYETVMRQEPAWYELAKKQPTPKDVWDAEDSFGKFAKRLTDKGYSEASDAVLKLLSTLKKQGKLRTTTEAVLAEMPEASM